MEITLTLNDWTNSYALISGNIYGTDNIIVDREGHAVSVLASKISQDEKRQLRATLKKIEPELQALKETCDGIEDSKEKDGLYSAMVTIDIAKIKQSEFNLLSKLACEQDYSFILDTFYE